MDIAKFATLLFKLATDQNVRHRFVQNPLRVLDDMGIEHDFTAEDIPETFQLPSMADLSREFEKHLRYVITADEVPHPFFGFFGNSDD